jgi:hypothetical protein
MSEDSKQELPKDDPTDETNPEFLKQLELQAEQEVALHLYETGLEWC